jgi:hypothetical protein
MPLYLEGKLWFYQPPLCSEELEWIDPAWRVPMEDESADADAQSWPGMFRVIFARVLVFVSCRLAVSSLRLPPWPALLAMRAARRLVLRAEKMFGVQSPPT